MVSDPEMVKRVIWDGGEKGVLGLGMNTRLSNQGEYMSTMIDLNGEEKRNMLKGGLLQGGVIAEIEGETDIPSLKGVRAENDDGTEVESTGISEYFTCGHECRLTLGSTP